MKIKIITFILSYVKFYLLLLMYFPIFAFSQKADTILWKNSTVNERSIKFTNITEIGKNPLFSSTFGILVNDRHSFTLGPAIDNPNAIIFNYRFILLNKKRTNPFIDFDLLIIRGYVDDLYYYTNDSYYDIGLHTGARGIFRFNKHFLFCSKAGIHINRSIYGGPNLSPNVKIGFEYIH